MKIQNTHTRVFLKKLIFFFMVSVLSCVEPFEESNFEERFEDVLVVSATITNEFKNQKVILTRSFRFDEDEAPKELNADVVVTDDLGQDFVFEQTFEGDYASIDPFKAELGRKYVLNIITENGDTYVSDEMELTVSNTTIDNLYAQRVVNNNQQDGIAIYIDSYDPTGNSRYYRHEFIETFKIIAPYWSPYDAVVISEGFRTFEIAAILREQEERVCYGENLSKNVLVNSTVGLSEDRLEQYNIRFIDRDNYILSYRYSILARQYVISQESFSYYETLSGLSQNSNNVFSEDQPGFLPGNVRSLSNPNENVVGFFDVAAVDERRIFFNYEDFFPNEELPRYAVGCSLFAPSTIGGIGDRDLLNIIYDDAMRFYDFNNGQIPGGGPFLMVPNECGDCTTLGSNDIPEFWTE